MHTFRRTLVTLLLVSLFTAAFLVGSYRASLSKVRALRLPQQTPSCPLGCVPGVQYDNFAFAQVITGTSGSTVRTNQNASAESGEPSHAGSPPSRSIWAKWTAPQNGCLTLHTTGSAIDTVLASYIGSSVTGLSPVTNGSNDNDGSATTSRVVFNATSGTVYNFAVDGKSGAQGSVTLAWSQTALACPTPTPSPTPTITPTPTPVPTPTPTPVPGGTINTYKIQTTPPNTAGKITITGFAGAAPGPGSISILNTSNSQTATATAQSDGSFSALITGSSGHNLRFTYGSSSVTAKAFTPTVVGVTPTIGASVPDAAFSTGYVYVLDPVGLRIMDISLPNNPQVVSTLKMPTKPTGIEVVGNYAFITTEYKAGGSSTALQIVDVSNKTSPRLVSSLFSNAGAKCIRIRVRDGQTLAYIGATLSTPIRSGLQIVNVTNPLVPVNLGFVQLSYFPWALAIGVRYVYANSPSAQGVGVIDAQNTSSPTFVGQALTTLGPSSKIAMTPTESGDVLAVPSSTGLKILGLSNPSSPALLATALSGTGVTSVHVISSGVVAVGATLSPYRLITLNINTPTIPQQLGSLSTSVQCFLVRASASLVLLDGGLGTDGLNLINVQSPIQPVKVGGVKTFAQTLALASFNNTAVAVAFNNRSFSYHMLWINNQNPLAPLVTTTTSASNIVRDAAFSDTGQWLIVGANSGSLLQVISPTTQAIIGSAATPSGGSLQALRVRGTLVYVAAGFKGLLIYSIASNGQPSLVGSVDTHGSAVGVEVGGNYAYVADSSGIQVVNVTNPAAPSLVGGYVASSGAALSLRVQGQYLYSANGGGGVQVLDISNPASPVVVATVGLGGFGGAERLDPSGNLLYVATGGPGLTIIDIGNPRTPAVVGLYPMFGFCSRVIAAGGLVYLADDYAVQAIVAITPPIQ